MHDSAIQGGCLCGGVRYTFTPPVQRMVHCHCSRCRKSSGAAHATNLTVAPDRFHWLQGDDAVARYELPEARSFGKWFCVRCGCPVPRLARNGEFMIVPAGSLDSPLPASPTDHIFWASRPAWHCPDGGLPTHAEYPRVWARARDRSLPSSA